MNASPCIELVFSSPDVELCLFHVMQSFKAKIESLSCVNNEKEALRGLCMECCYATSEKR